MLLGKLMNPRSGGFAVLSHQVPSDQRRLVLSYPKKPKVLHSRKPGGRKTRAPGFIEQTDGKLVPPPPCDMASCSSSPSCRRLPMNNRGALNTSNTSATQQCMMGSWGGIPLIMGSGSACCGHMTTGHVDRGTKCDDPSLISSTDPHARSHPAPRAQETKRALTGEIQPISCVAGIALFPKFRIRPWKTTALDCKATVAEHASRLYSLVGNHPSNRRMPPTPFSVFVSTHPPPMLLQ